MTILVTGARGHVARSLVRQLLAAGQPIRAAGRDPGAARVPAGVETTHCDLADPGTFDQALAGVGKVFLYAEPRGVDDFVAAAASAGVEHIVLLSALLHDPASADAISRMHGDAERAVTRSGVAWTFLRPGGFATNTLQWAPSVRAEGVVRDPFPESRSAPVHEADIAAVAVRALTEPGHEGAAYTLTGPELVTRRRQAELIGDAVGRPVRFDVQDLEHYRAELSAWTTPQVAEAVIRETAAAVDRPAPPTDTVAKVTGRPARTYGEWARDHAADFGAGAL
ncbi:NAD(P)H-binding protein [Nonomuraea sp. SMC257]|uniref:NAD(P)H-binding protein n=1 Tax=Nonomuraea montanisoli TaxID=2741721 RepID=A0A7Y6I8N4_9ACTN|nr:NAD(P)H-binding protein [Nonomuraea montanisoli]NUW33747.1 NAD(P)H-binding protein [Nonomuraea montanisoli]